ncbi:MAG TPA: hypothetical protein VIG57_03100, partial [Candidatus Entotheonella sp.]
AFARNDVIESASQITDDAVRIVLTELLFFHGAQFVEDILQTTHNTALAIRHAPLHEHTQGLLDITTLQEVFG